MKLLHCSRQDMLIAWIRQCNKNTEKWPQLRYILEIDAIGLTKGLGAFEIF